MNKIIYAVIVFATSIINNYSIAQSTNPLFDKVVKDVTFGSDLFDEGKQVFRSGKDVYVFGNTRSTTINNDVKLVYGKGDVFIEKYDSVGNVNYKMLGGGGLDQLIKVEQDSYGFWVYMSSESGSSGTRSLPLTCNNAFSTYNWYTFGDVWVVRLDKKLNKVSEYSICLQDFHIKVQDQFLRCVELNKVSNRVKMVVMGYPDTVGLPRTNYLIVTDTVGFIIDKMYLGRAEKIVSTPYGCTTPGNNCYYNNVVTLTKYINKMITISDSITVFLQDYQFSIGSVGNVMRVNTVTKRQSNLLFKSQRGSTKLKAGIVVNGQIHIYSENVPIAIPGRNMDSLLLSSGYYWYARAAAAKTVPNKSDVWCFVVNPNTLNLYREYAIGSNDSTIINEVFLINNKIHLALSSKGGVAFDKNSPSKGGFDFWLAVLNNNGTIGEQVSFGGSKDDIMNDVLISNGSMFLTGFSKSGAGGDKSVGSRDANKYGDSWTKATCYNPIINYTVNDTVFTNGGLLSITNNSTNAINYNWTFYTPSLNYLNSTATNPKEYLYDSDSVGIFCIADNYNCNSYGSSKIVVKPYFVGLDELSRGDVSVYPNPFNDEININGIYNGEYEFELFNVLGVKLVEGKISNSIKIYTEFLKPGYYTLNLKLKNKIINYKLLKD